MRRAARGDRELRRGRIGPVLGAAVHARDDDVGSRAARRRRVGEHARDRRRTGVEDVDGPGLARRFLDPVQAERPGEVGHPHAVDVHDVRGLALGLGAVGAGVADAVGVQRVQRADQAVEARVHGVVGRGGAGVVARVLERVDDLGLYVERRVAGEGAAGVGHGRLEVADGEIGGADRRRDRAEDAAEVVAGAVRLARGGRAADQRAALVDQDVAGGDHGERLGPRRDRPGCGDRAHGGRFNEGQRTGGEGRGRNDRHDGRDRAPAHPAPTHGAAW